MVYYLTLEDCSDYDVNYVNSNICPCKRVRFDIKVKVRVDCKNIDMLKDFFGDRLLEIMTVPEHALDVSKAKRMRSAPRYKKMKEVKFFLEKNPKVRRILKMAIYNHKYQDSILENLPMYFKEFRDQSFLNIAFEVTEKGLI